MTGKEVDYIVQSVSSGKISGNGIFTEKCHAFFKRQYNFPKVLLTSSCTDALEMTAILSKIQQGDEVIIPSFTFVSTANAFVLRGAKIVFADSQSENPNIDHTSLESLITPRTKAIIVVHYAGIACDMDEIMRVARDHKLLVIEDAAHAIDSFYKGKALGSIGDLSTFSFHETKNVISGEGGMLIVNNPSLESRSEIIWEKGTNRSAFFKGEVDKYGWVDIGSSFLPSDIIAAFLFAQLENLKAIQTKRVALWQRYRTELKQLKEYGVGLPEVPTYASVNGHLFYLLCRNQTERDCLIAELKQEGILAVFHYLPLHLSPFYKSQHEGASLPNSILHSERLLRLPLYYDLSFAEQDEIIEHVKRFYR